MKKLCLLLIVVFAGCSSAPRKVLMKNCEDAGGGFYYCEVIPPKPAKEWP
jgi:hypothetical protein